MFDNQLRPYYQGRVLMNDSALNDPAIIAVLDEMALRNFKDCLLYTSPSPRDRQ